MTKGRMTHWTERRFYSVAHDCEMARISGYDHQCQEHWILMEVVKGYRESRDVAVERLQKSIEAGGIPGEIK
jgi:hypothetical protein